MLIFGCYSAANQIQVMKRIFTITLLCLLAFSGFSQSEANFWYFGDHAGVSFQTGDPVAQTDGALSTWEGCSSISTSEGILRFYTDGITVWNKNHQVMPHGTGLLGDPSSSQSGIIVPKPGSSQLYYVFSIDDVDDYGGINGLNYTLVDMTLDGFKGDVVTTEKNVHLTDPICEKVTAVGHSNGTDIWVITQKWKTNDFYAYKVTTSGVDPVPVISSAGIIIDGGDPPNVNIDVAKGYMKVSPDGTKLAKANAGLKSVEIFDFNNTTGVVSNGIIDNNVGGEPYGIEFSPNNNFLYVNTWKSNPGMYLYQYDLKAGDIIGSRTQITTGLNGALQLAPDNRIYASMGQNGQYLSRINQPNKAGSNCNFQYNAVYLEGRSSMWGLPPFVQSFFTFNAGYFNDPPCFGYPTQFYENSSQTPDSVLWDFGNPASGNENSSTELNPTHNFTGAGIYNVKLTVWIQGYEDVASKFINVTIPPVLNLGEDTFFCEGDTYTLDAGEGYTDYLWSTGETTQTIGVQTAGTYWCIIHDEAGCSDGDTIVLNAFPKPQVNLGDDLEFCEGELYELDAGSGFESYLWSTGDTTQTLVIQSTGNYWVEVYNEFGCPNRDTIYALFNEKPVASAGPNQTIDQGQTTFLEGSATGGSGEYTYEWQPANMLVQNDIPNPQTQPIIDPTIFTLVVTDSKGCVSASDQVLINLYGSTLSAFPYAEPSEFCYGESTQVSANATGGGGEYTYSWTSDPPGFTSDQESFSDTPLVDTRYYLDVSDQYGNTSSSYVDVKVIQTDPIDLVPEYIIPSGQDTITVCVRDSVMLDAGSPDDPETTTYFWTNANMLGRYYKATTNGNWIDIQTHEVVVNYGGETSCERHGIITIVFDYNQCAIGIPENHPDDQVVDIFPNPNNGNFTLILKENMNDIAVKVYDIQGNLVAQDYFQGRFKKGDRKSLKIKNLDKGIFIVYIGSEKYHAVRKMIVN